jgi:hypothetical protein
LVAELKFQEEEAAFRAAIKQKRSEHIGTTGIKEVEAISK